ncbi:uncharacterized protein si:ch211-252f13.5 [Silurus meridionalis]|uniref:TNFR-Cys domain-containing protein n=1 Tax=Silurus meridionalis TaxID=175797 RepID=A0A8T0BFK9_SILME|nr:uncharacterized protein si:ch211-252f13.5 [Silurus meridionalis]KAF7705982.1 hypothetical protein HF521_019236 [Silurus meridionalis]
MGSVSTLLWLTYCVAAACGGSAAEVCTGARCASARAGTPRRPAVPYTIIHPSAVARQERAGGRGATAEERAQTQTQTQARAHAHARGGCAGAEQCAQSKRQPCAGRECITHMRDGAERAPREFANKNGIQLSCDVKPGSNEVPSEDALVLQIHLEKGQEKLVEELQAQQTEARHLQNGLKDQQDILQAQQKEILDQQRMIFEQMEQVKVQYQMVIDNFRNMAQYKDLEGHLDSFRSEIRTHSPEAYTMPKVNMEESVIEVGRQRPGCSSCKADEYCEFSGDWPRCEKCTVCLPGFFLVSQCSTHTDQMCQDRDECLEIDHLCGDQSRCLNTPGGFRCTGMSTEEAAAGMCGHSYFFNSELQECQACSECDSQASASPCSAMRDTICFRFSETLRLSLSWSGEVSLVQGSEFPNMQLRIQGKSDEALVSCAKNWLVLHQHGLVWVDHNLALRHGCRSFVQAGLRFNSSDDGGRDLSGMRMEQRDGKSLQSISVSGVTIVDPGHTLSLFLKTTSNHCNAENEMVHLQNGLVAPFSLFWLSHDTGAIAMTAQILVSAHFHSNYRPTFRISLISDPYMVTLSHDNREIHFTEKGTVKFVLQQALYSMGQACISEGFLLVSYLNRNRSSVELARVFKNGVHYRDTSVSLSAAAAVDAGDTLTFEILAPAQCSVRYFCDDSGISMLSLMWIPSSVSSALSATISKRFLPFGAVRNKPLFFHQTSPAVSQLQLASTNMQHAHRNFIFREAGTVSVALDLRLIHSCSVIELALVQQGVASVVLARQLGGQMPEGSEWASLGLRVSFPVENGTEVYSMVNCVRGRLNQIAHDAGSSISILWIAAGHV